MRKTGSEIESDVYAIILASQLKTVITGSLYKEGMRPIDAKTEDAVVSFMTGLDSQIQTGVVNVNTYVPDIDMGSGSMVKNGSRCRVLEILIDSIVHELVPGEYRFVLGAIVQTFAASEINQHFVNAKIKFELATF